MVSTLVNLVLAAAAVAGAYVAWRSMRISKAQLELIEKKIGMVTDPAKMLDVLPIWYVERMAADDWGFGILMTSGDILAISRIVGVSDDGNWLEVNLLGPNSHPIEIGDRTLIYAVSDDRIDASIRVDRIEAAFEIWTS